MAVVALGGCSETPEFSTTPVISFNSVYFKDESPIDYIYLTINYKDGDGDLGLSNDDLLQYPFQTLNPDSSENVNHYNIFPVLYRKNGDSYEAVLPEGYRGIFPRLRENDRKAPIEGTIQYKLGSFNFFNEDSSVAKIKVSIQDRALHKSNEIETPLFPVIYK